MTAKLLSIRPLYLQVRDALADRISKGEWKPGQILRNEVDLARELGVSPGTARKALDILESEHLVTRHQGRGTFVNDHSSDELALRYINIRGPDGNRLMGDVKSSEITKNAANEIECARLSLQKGDKIYRIRRVRLTGGKPFMLEEASVPAALFPGLEERSAFTHRVVCLAQKYGLLLGGAEERISAAGASPEIAKALGVPRGSPVAVLDRVVRTIDGQPVEWRTAWCDLAKNHYLARMD
jgi:GntR family transcriptional regulator